MAEKVVLRRCERYGDPAQIAAIVREGMEELRVRPKGNVLVKPNAVFAHRRYGRHAYTNPDVLEGLFAELKRESAISEIILGERCAVTVPTRYVFRQCGYTALCKRMGIRRSFFDEEKKRNVFLEHGTVHRSIRLAESILDADFKIWAPKLKNHVSSKITCTLKLNMGICDSKERLFHHDFLLEEKIADLYEVGRPDFIVVDAIEGGERNEMVPRPVDIGVIMMGTNGVAVDAVGARILGLEPEEVDHLMIAHRRGFGPVSLDEIEIAGDISLDEVCARVGPIDRSFNDLRTMDLPLHLHLAPPPGRDDLCHTGCINMLKAVFATKEAHEPGSIAKLRPFHVVVGDYQGDVIGNGEPVVLVGDCTRVNGTLAGHVRHVKGCPVPVPFFTLFACHYGKVRSPYLDPKAMWTLPIYAGGQQIMKMTSRFRSRNSRASGRKTTIPDASS